MTGATIRNEGNGTYVVENGVFRLRVNASAASGPIVEELVLLSVPGANWRTGSRPLAPVVTVGDTTYTVQAGNLSFVDAHTNDARSELYLRFECPDGLQVVQVLSASEHEPVWRSRVWDAGATRTMSKKDRTLAGTRTTGSAGRPPRPTAGRARTLPPSRRG